MKKYFILAAAAIMMVACNQKEMENDGVQEPKVINLTASINSGEDVTRATGGTALQNTAFVAGKQIFVEAYEKEQTEAYLTGTYTTGANGALTGSMYYPANNKNIDICAFYPSTISSGTTEFSVQTDQSTDAEDGDLNYQNSDLMFATKLTNKASGETHNLTFNHALTKIVVNIEYAENMVFSHLTTSPTVTEVEIMNTVPTASFTISGGEIAANAINAKAQVAVAPINIKGTGFSEGVFNNEGIIVPQTVAAGSNFIRVKFNNENYYYALPTAAATTFQSGKIYTYNLTLSARGLVLSATTITNWTVETGEGANTGDSAGITI